LLHQVSDLLELNVKLRFQKVKLITHGRESSVTDASKLYQNDRLQLYGTQTAHILVLKFDVPLTVFILLLPAKHTIRGNSVIFNDSIFLHSFPLDFDFVLLQPAVFTEVILMFYKYLCWILRNYVAGEQNCLLKTWIHNTALQFTM